MPTQQFISSFLRISKRKKKISPQRKEKFKGGDGDQNNVQIWMITMIKMHCSTASFNAHSGYGIFTVKQILS